MFLKVVDFEVDIKTFFYQYHISIMRELKN